MMGADSSRILPSYSMQEDTRLNVTNTFVLKRGHLPVDRTRNSSFFGGGGRGIDSGVLIHSVWL